MRREKPFFYSEAIKTAAVGKAPVCLGWFSLELSAVKIEVHRKEAQRERERESIQ